MGEIVVNGGANQGTALKAILEADDIQPGAQPGYNLCKQIYAYHPLGGKIVDQPIDLAQSQRRMISVPAPSAPEDRLREAFEAQWKADGADDVIANWARQAQIYGAASIAALVAGVENDQPLEYEKLYKAELSFNVFDPLNTAGSLVLNQDPNAMDFQKHRGIRVSGVSYHRSRSVTLFNEKPLYIEYTASAFGFVGRSVYQRALFMLKSYLNTLVTNDMIATKAGVLIIKVKQQSSIIDQAMAMVGAIKRSFVKEARTGNVLQIATEEEVESLNLQNLDGAFGMARKNIIEDIASAAGRPAKLLLQESFAEGFGEGSEDAAHIAQFIKKFREWMAPGYDFFDKIIQYRAWNPDFYKALQNEFPERYEGVDYQTAFYEWKNAFRAEWPSLIEEPDSEKIKVDEVKLKAILAFLQVLAAMLDPENKARAIEWALDNINAMKLMFTSPLTLDIDALLAYTPPAPAEEEKPPKPWSSQDSQQLKITDAVRELDEAVARLPLSPRERKLAVQRFADSVSLKEAA